jgi:hypothetical protein
MRHLIRPAALLAGVVGIIIVARIVPTPEVLDAYGFYSGGAEENIEEWKSLPEQYVGSDKCQGCHEPQHDLWRSADHAVVNCEDCHGPGRAHLEDAETPVIDHARGFCGSCHDRLVSRPARFPQVDMDVMGGEAECTICHNSHSPRVGIPQTVPHPLTEHEVCTDCHASHDPWETTPTQVPHSLEGRDNCVSCHGPEDVRGEGLPTIPSYMVIRECFTCHGHDTGNLTDLPPDHAGRPQTTCENCHRPEGGTGLTE